MRKIELYCLIIGLINFRSSFTEPKIIYEGNTDEDENEKQSVYIHLFFFI